MFYIKKQLTHLELKQNLINPTTIIYHDYTWNNFVGDCLIWPYLAHSYQKNTVLIKEKKL